MSILNPPAPPPATPAQRATNDFRFMTDRSIRILNDQAKVLIDAWKFVWVNPQGLTPQQACDVIQAYALDNGDTCIGVFTKHAGVAYLNSMLPGIIPDLYAAIPPGAAYTPNQDGSLSGVTVPDTFVQMMKSQRR